MTFKDKAQGFADELGKQFIARPDEAKARVLYKWPHKNIRLGSQVTVQPDEWAYFVKKGEIVGYLAGGQHNVDGADIPFFGKFVDSITEGNFLMSEVYFVGSRDFTGRQFGGAIGQVTDPQTLLAVSAGVHGEYTFRVTDPGRLILGLVGTGGSDGETEIQGAIKDQLVKHTRAIISSRIRDESWDITRVTDGSMNVVLEPLILEAVNSELVGYGLTVTKIEDFTVAITDDSWAAYQELTQRRARTRLAQDPAYHDMAKSEVMLGAAEGLRNGQDGGMLEAITGAGVGAGLGLGIGSQMLGGVETRSGGPATPPTAASRVCPECSAAVAADSKFCPECGAALNRTCSECGAVATGKFCPECGTALASGE